MLFQSSNFSLILVSFKIFQIVLFWSTWCFLSLGVPINVNILQGHLVSIKLTSLSCPILKYPWVSISMFSKVILVITTLDLSYLHKCSSRSFVSALTLSLQSDHMISRSIYECQWSYMHWAYLILVEDLQPSILHLMDAIQFYFKNDWWKPLQIFTIRYSYSYAHILDKFTDFYKYKTSLEYCYVELPWCP